MFTPSEKVVRVLMRLVVDPCQFRSHGTEEAIAAVASAGFDAIELSPRQGLYQHRSGEPPVPAEVRRLKEACAQSGVEVASIFVVQPWASTEDDERRAAVRALVGVLHLAGELACGRVNTELTGNPDDRAACQAAFLRSAEELAPVVEEAAMTVVVEPHPYDFIESNRDAVDLVASLANPRIGYLFCCPHLYHLGEEDVGQMLHYAAPVLRHVHLADTFRPSRVILNPPGPNRVHQHLDVGQGELNWPAIFDALSRVGFDDVLTVAAFAWPDEPEQSLARNRQAVEQLLDGAYGTQRSGRLEGGRLG
jgi:myo-inositol catabolism protein IolH